MILGGNRSRRDSGPKRKSKRLMKLNDLVKSMTISFMRSFLNLKIRSHHLMQMLISSTKICFPITTESSARV